MRLMCIDDSGKPELKFGEVYNLEYAYQSPCCKSISYALFELKHTDRGLSPNHKKYICESCNNTFDITPENMRQRYRASRFIEIDEYADLLTMASNIGKSETETA